MSTINVLGKGESGCIIDDYIREYCVPHVLPNASLFIGNRMVTKVYKHEHEFESDKMKSQNLAIIDPLQDHFVYPIAFCKVTARPDVMQACGMSTSSLFMSEMKYAGKSLEQMRQDGVTLSVDQSMKIYDDIASALTVLHNNRISHGDLHAHNVLVDTTSKMPKATLIDFGNPNRPVHDDIDDFATRIVRALATVTEDGEYKQRLQAIAMEATKKRFATLHAVSNTPIKNTVMSRTRTGRPKKLAFDEEEVVVKPTNLFGDFEYAK
jgi:tRNA A-37 threonylcarbamoyl transferase component Bud32